MKEKYFHMYGKATDTTGAEHVVTVVGKFEQYTEKEETVLEGTTILEGETKERNATVIVPFKKTVRNLKIGYSICHPNDEFNEEVGVAIAKKRIKNGDYVGELTTNNITMLNDDQCTLNIFGELTYIINHIDKYLPTEDDATEEPIKIDEASGMPYIDIDENVGIGYDYTAHDPIDDLIFNDDSPQSLGVAPSFDDLEDLKTYND